MSVRVALAQLTAGADREANLERARRHGLGAGRGSGRRRLPGGR
jgi:hypothetical protein